MEKTQLNQNSLQHSTEVMDHLLEQTEISAETKLVYLYLISVLQNEPSTVLKIETMAGKLGLPTHTIQTSVYQLVSDKNHRLK